MKKPSSRLMVAGIIVAAILFQTAFIMEPDTEITTLSQLEDKLKKEALEVLNSRCNSCHRKQNPFMIFTHKNMDRRIDKINEQVFIKRRMPKGDNQLSTEERVRLKNWIKSNI